MKRRLNGSIFELLTFVSENEIQRYLLDNKILVVRGKSYAQHFLSHRSYRCRSGGFQSGLLVKKFTMTNTEENSPRGEKPITEQVRQAAGAASEKVKAGAQEAADTVSAEAAH